MNLAKFKKDEFLKQAPKGRSSKPRSFGRALNYDIVVYEVATSNTRDQVNNMRLNTREFLSSQGPKSTRSCV